MKKLLHFLPLMALCMVLLFFLPQQSDAASASDLTFTLNANGNSYSVTDCDESAGGTLTIPSTYNGKPVTGIGDYAFSNCTGLTGITIPNSVTSIGTHAFYNCTGLTGITIPDSVTNMGGAALRGCSSLESITIPFVGNMKKTASAPYQYPFGFIFGVFSYADSLAITQGYYCLGNRITADTYYIPASLKSVTVTGGNILYGAFANCINLTEITLCNSVTRIENYAFNRCTGLTSVTIGDSVTNIASFAFYGCGSLESITIPFVGGSKKTASDTDQYPFGYIFGTSDYTGGVATQQYYYGSSTSNMTYSTYYIPASLKSVTVTGGDLLCGAFYNCTNLTSITLPDGEMVIHDRAFYNCGSLMSLTIPDAVTSVGSFAFTNCMNLPYNIYDHALYLGSAENPYLVFVGVQPDIITTIKIHDDTKIIACSAFVGCYGLESVTIPASVTGIGDSAFSACKVLKDVYYNATQAQWDAISIGLFNEPLLNAALHCKMPEEVEDGTLKLAGNVTIGELTVQTGQTLDLNGHTLTVNSLASFGQIIDSAGGGGLIVSNVEMSGNNWLPIQDESGCYRFYAYTQENLGTKATGNSVSFGFALDFADQTAYTALLSSGDVQLTVVLDWGTGSREYAFSRELVAKYVTLVAEYPALRPYMKLNVTGLDSLETGIVITVTPVVTTMGGKIQNIGCAMTYTA